MRLQYFLLLVTISTLSSWSTLYSIGDAMAEGQSKFSQEFFSQAAPIMMEDKLASNLGAVDKGAVFVYNYEDAVKMAGHSCLAISGAYRLTEIALKRLYGDKTPIRGEIEVTFRGDVEHKVNGPISQVVTLITGAAAQNGFKGFGGKKFRRYNLLRFDKNNPPKHDVVCSVIFKRVDTGKSVEISYANNMLPSLPDMQEKVKLVLLGEANNIFVINEI